MTPFATLQNFYDAVRSFAGRGTIHEGFNTVTVCVPAWKVKRVYEALQPLRPLGVRLVVRRLTVRQHFALWHVRILIDVSVN